MIVVVAEGARAFRPAALVRTIAIRDYFSGPNFPA
jgi:hypothetical protein